MHIKSFGFRGLRKLYLNMDYIDEDFEIDEIDQFQASRLNIIVGPNGAGKSTVVDLVRAMGDAAILPTIPRENCTVDTASGFVVRFTNGTVVKALFNSVRIDTFGVAIKSNLGAHTYSFRGEISKDASKSLPIDCRDVIKSLAAEVTYRNKHDESGVPVDKFVHALNENGKHLIGLIAFPLAEGQATYPSNPDFTLHPNVLNSPIECINNNLVSVRFNDDHYQLNNIPIGMFPSGWRAFGGLIAWLENQSKNSICVIEEPETHLHPKLQRLLMEQICAIAEKRELQIFVSTHSSTLIDIYNWPEKKVKLFEANGFRLRELTNPAMALKNLGVRPSDICQSNGVIWVEGASDRLYILHWLNLLCQKTGERMPTENIEFSFAFYGGSMLNHFSVHASANLIDIFKINQNSIIVMDCDLDFDTDKNNNKIPKNPKSAKAEILQAMNTISGDSNFCWVTQGYTLESYLPSKFRRRYYTIKKKRLKSKSSYSKVAVADIFKNEFSGFDLSYMPHSDLAERIRQIYSSIIEWNK